ncbi:PREDICTED: E3 ubiquitin-protein ligase TRIM71-like [Amphimedon queenslandica]|uniref:Uncharacterized protein n=1 Tax=Amphimedon queenslandica TaxID=400682 RepID=A0AAN0IYV4_AMPQE|nr:PREDICTED: E3 ubiquitin-protein ligase TRIM71-like [Amphimedon queenslandica]|eukprot:XP_019849949.1 PREDICTED: E3 ubiquitin-protein ligase TRIM71-like [Amphimedon queenslandica]
MYVADTYNHRIQKFSPGGKFVSQFGSKGSGPGQLILPIGITIDTAATGLVYVGDGNHHISVFTSDGVFVRKFGSEGNNIDHIKYPFGLTFDKDGLLYVCDCRCISRRPGEYSRNINEATGAVAILVGPIHTEN